MTQEQYVKDIQSKQWVSRVECSIGSKMKGCDIGVVIDGKMYVNGDSNPKKVMDLKNNHYVLKVNYGQNSHKMRKVDELHFDQKKKVHEYDDVLEFVKCSEGDERVVSNYVQNDDDTLRRGGMELRWDETEPSIPREHVPEWAWAGRITPQESSAHIHVLVHVGPSLHTDIIRMIIALGDGATVGIMKTRLSDILAVARERIAIYEGNETRNLMPDWQPIPATVTVVDVMTFPTLNVDYIHILGELGKWDLGGGGQGGSAKVLDETMCLVEARHASGVSTPS